MHHSKTNDNPTCPNNKIQQDGRCKYTQRPNLSSVGTFQFTYTDFCECSNYGNGGIVYFSFSTLSPTSLLFDHCVFTDCSCEDLSSDRFGGSLYVYNISSVSVSHSCFRWNKDTRQTSSGGALFFASVPSVSIYDDTFIKCCVASLGGAVYIYNCSTVSRTAKEIDDCRFFNCRGTETYGWGGSMRAGSNHQYNNFITNSLFSGCSNYYGGAFFLSYPGSFSPSSYISSAMYPVKFCFFNKNFFLHGGAENDVVIFADISYTPTDDEPIFQHCFSTTSSNRVGYYISDGYLSKDVNWLPLALNTYASKEDETYSYR